MESIPEIQTEYTGEEHGKADQPPMLFLIEHATTIPRRARGCKKPQIAEKQGRQNDGGEPHSLSICHQYTE
jgi:hypothetical protein